MELNADTCYQAMLSHDARFDGRFFGGVTTTGIYCRPVCRVTPPRFENVRWFACAAAAEAAGFRPCRRCRPESAPGTPAWIGSSAVVSRALRLINEGALDETDLENFSARLGVGSRHLRRLFAEHLGASPNAIATARRTHFAARLIEETALPFTEIAFAAGFNSVRQFNEAMRATFQQAPTEIRQRSGLKTVLKHSQPATGALTLRLPYRPPLDWARMSGFLQARTIPGVEAATESTYRRTIQINNQSGVIELQYLAEAAHLLLRAWLPQPNAIMPIVERARRIFDLSAEPQLIHEHLSRDPVLANAVNAARGLRVPGAWDAFELSVRAILGQQVSVAAARTLASRFAAAFGTACAAPLAELTTVFPTPENLAARDPHELTALGILPKRAQTILALARALAAHELTLSPAADPVATIEQLQTIPGIGAWTAHYIAMRALSWPDAFPHTDLGVMKALNEKNPKRILAIGEAWRPWRAYAVMHLWLKEAS
jgi:AraC family transcriptional regulator, regulatory protein of adaptative response / DNA-3-methyladenine glycosylase II